MVAIESVQSSSNSGREVCKYSVFVTGLHVKGIKRHLNGLTGQYFETEIATEIYSRKYPKSSLKVYWSG